tara:strand:+ start:1729 stop:1998 length:270 start_codon:yes stop_codon:yes gene_type:complete
MKAYLGGLLQEVVQLFAGQRGERCATLAGVLKGKGRLGGMPFVKFLQWRIEVRLETQGGKAILRGAIPDDMEDNIAKRRIARVAVSAPI